MKKLLLLFLTGFVMSCSPKVYFTQQLRQDIENANIPLTSVQFYNDREVTLVRVIDADQKANVQSGKVVFEDGKYYHLVKLRNNTPGVCREIKPNELDISFEEGPSRYLTFAKIEKDKLANQNYNISALEWVDNNDISRTSWAFTSNDLYSTIRGVERSVGRINYDGKEFFILPTGRNAQLKIKKSFINKIHVEKRQMKGVRIR